MKNEIRKFVLDQGVDDVGFAAVPDYKSGTPFGSTGNRGTLHQL
jgi:hypothetical protein